MKFDSGYTPSKTIIIKNKEGQEYWLNFVDGKLDVGGNLPMSEAAEIFFAEVKQIAGVAMQQPTAPAGAIHGGEMKIHGLRFVDKPVPAPECGEGFVKQRRILQMLVAPSEETERNGGYSPVWVDVPFVEGE